MLASFAQGSAMEFWRRLCGPGIVPCRSCRTWDTSPRSLWMMLTDGAFTRALASPYLSSRLSMWKGNLSDESSIAVDVNGVCPTGHQKGCCRASKPNRAGLFGCLLGF